MKYSKQKNAILNNVLSRCDHPNAKDIYESVKNDMPNISLGTVYRNLNSLSEMHRIKKIHISGDSDRFDKNLDNHVHFYCIRCNRVSDIMNMKVETLYQVIEKQINHKILSMNTVITGICNSCNRKEEK